MNIKHCKKTRKLEEGDGGLQMQMIEALAENEIGQVNTNKV